MSIAIIISFKKSLESNAISLPEIDEFPKTFQAMQRDSCILQLNNNFTRCSLNVTTSEGLNSNFGAFYYSNQQSPPTRVMPTIMYFNREMQMWYRLFTCIAAYCNPITGKY